MTLLELLATLERRAAEADAIGATAPVASVYRQVVEELRPLAGEGNGRPAAEPAVERWLTAAEVAERLHTSERWCYDHQAELGGKRLSRRCLRFPEAGVRRYVERRR